MTNRGLILAAGLAIAAAVSSARAQTQYEIILHTGDLPRVESPISFELPGGSGEPGAARLELEGAGAIPVQIERVGGKLVAHAVLSGRHARGETFKGTLTIAPGSDAAGQAQQFRFESREAGTEDLLFGDRPIWRFMHAFDPDDLDETYKPFHHVYDFDGERYLTKGSGGTYTHHRGLFVGWNKTFAEGKEYDFWHMKPEGTVQKLIRFIEEDSTAGPAMARRVMLIHWVDPEGKLIIEETRRLTAHAQPLGRHVIDVGIHLESRAGSIRLEGDAQHAGFQFRASQIVHDEQKRTSYLIPEGATRDDDDLMSGDWATLRFQLAPRHYAVTDLAHPSNRHRDTAVFSTRAYGRFGEFFPTVLEEDEPMDLKYRLIIVDIVAQHEPTGETSRLFFEDYVNPIRVEVEEKK